MLIEIPYTAHYPRLNLRRHPPRNTQAIELGSHTAWACHQEVRDNEPAEKDLTKWEVSHWVYDYSKPTPVSATIRLEQAPRETIPPKQPKRRRYMVKEMVPIIKDRVLHPDEGRYVRVWRTPANVAKFGKTPLARANGRRLISGFRHKPSQVNSLTPDLMLPKKQYFSGVSMKRDQAEDHHLVLAEVTCHDLWTEQMFDDLMDTLKAVEDAKPKKHRRTVTSQDVVDHITMGNGLQLDFVDDYKNYYFGVHRDYIQEFGIDGQQTFSRELEEPQEHVLPISQ